MQQDRSYQITEYPQESETGRIRRLAAMATLSASAVVAIAGLLFSAPWLGVVAFLLIGSGLALSLAVWRENREQCRRVVAALEAATQAQEIQSHRLEAFREIAASVEQTLDLREVLELGLEKVLQVSGQEAAEIHLLDADEHTMSTKASIGGPEGFQVREELMVVGECLCGLAMLNEKPLIVPDIESDERVTRLSCVRFGFQSAACVPLRVKGRAIGVLTVHGREKRHFDSEDMEVLGAVANQMAIAIENARLYADMEARVGVLSRRLQHLAVVEERERLGREMHDGVAQTLSLLSIQLAQVRSLLSDDDVEGIAAELQEMGRVIDAGYEEVREAITNLRLAAPKGAEWVDWLREYVYDFGARHDLAAGFEMPSGQEPIVLPPDEEVQLTRIVQEALNNVRKHAQASEVHMALVPNGRKMKLLIRDDGTGFDVEQMQSREGRYGLSTMRERAELLGGSLKVQSRPGKGTTITVEIGRDGTAED
jgi:two-component system nitrate/nitrite sensor histidine kinase NarX